MQSIWIERKDLQWTFDLKTCVRRTPPNPQSYTRRTGTHRHFLSPRSLSSTARSCDAKRRRRRCSATAGGTGPRTASWPPSRRGSGGGGSSLCSRPRRRRASGDGMLGRALAAGAVAGRTAASLRLRCSGRQCSFCCRLCRMTEDGPCRLDPACLTSAATSGSTDSLYQPRRARPAIFCTERSFTHGVSETKALLCPLGFTSLRVAAGGGLLTCCPHTCGVRVQLYGTRELNPRLHCC